MPRYQLELVALLDDLLMVLGGWNWKKPRTNLPFLETSLPPAARTWPAVRVSLLAATEEEHNGVVCKRRRPSDNM